MRTMSKYTSLFLGLQYLLGIEDNFFGWKPWAIAVISFENYVDI